MILERIICIEVMIIKKVIIRNKMVFRLFKQKNKLEEFSKDKLAKQKWLYHYFKVPFTLDKGLTKKEQEETTNQLRENLLGFVLGAFTSADSKKIKGGYHYLGRLGKDITIKVINEKGQNYFLIRFIDTSKEKQKLAQKVGEGIILTNVSNPNKKSYLFTPLQSIIAIKIMPQIEHSIYIATGGIEPHKNMIHLTFEDNKPYVTEFDGIQWFSYPLERRIELGKKYPEIDKQLFGENYLEKFIKWILKKKNYDNHMKKYCEGVEKLLKKYENKKEENE